MYSLEVRSRGDENQVGSSCFTTGTGRDCTEIEATTGVGVEVVYCQSKIFKVSDFLNLTCNNEKPIWSLEIWK